MRKKRYGSGVEQRGQIVNRSPISERPVSVGISRTVGHWVGNTVFEQDTSRPLWP